LKRGGLGRRRGKIKKTAVAAPRKAVAGKGQNFTGALGETENAQGGQVAPGKPGGVKIGWKRRPEKGGWSLGGREGLSNSRATRYRLKSKGHRNIP